MPHQPLKKQTDFYHGEIVQVNRLLLRCSYLCNDSDRPSRFGVFGKTETVVRDLFIKFRGRVAVKDPRLGGLGVVYYVPNPLTKILPRE